MITKKRNKSGVLCYWLTDQPKTKSRTEDCEQIDLVSHCKRYWSEQSSLMFHVPNESKVPAHYRAKLGSMGILKGASDWMILIPSNGRPYMALELKRSRKKDSSVSKEQTKFLLDAESVGAFAVVCYGHKAALQAIDDYLSGRTN